MSRPLVGHIDADCFYVSCERLRSRALHAIPVGVLSNQGAVVIAKSYELKAAGVTTGMPIWDARPLCPEAVFIKRDFHWYESLSRKLLEAIRSVSPAVEFYSIDEQFFDASHLERHFQQDLSDAARSLKLHIFSNIGLPMSVGVSRTKTLAKLASSASKPFGSRVLIDPAAIADFIADCPVEKVTGIARRRAKRLAAYGIRTCGEFVAADRRLIRRLLTKSGEELWWELQGTMTKTILTTRPSHRFISRGGSVGRATDDRERLYGWLVRNIERLIEALDLHAVFCSELQLMLHLKSGGRFASRASLPESTSSFRLLLEAGRKLFLELWHEGLIVHHMHLLAGKLSFRHVVQRSLFDSPTEKEQRIAEVKRLVNQKIGRFRLRSGATLPLFELYHDEASDYEICDIEGKTCF